jgi:hypothetical protein
MVDFDSSDTNFEQLKFEFGYYGLQVIENNFDLK